MKAISGATCELAWLEAAEHLAAVSGHDEHNLVVEIKAPTKHEAPEQRLYVLVNEFLAERDQPLTTVAGTIFPAAQYLDFGPRGVYDVYPEEVYPTIKLGREWGRYAYRLVRWPPEDPSRLNPLKDLVKRLKRAVASKTGYKNFYELSLSDPGIDLPLYDAATDRDQGRGRVPCLSHLSFKLGAEKTLYLTALYRSHNFISKALGNYLGLADLQAFVCDQTGLAPGPLVVISTYAILDPKEKKWSVGDALKLVQQARTVYGHAQPPPPSPEAESAHA